MPYRFFPERETADPDGVADKFSEALTFNEGYWQSITGSANLVLDDKHVASRLHSIMIDSPWGASDYYIGAMFTLYEPFDLSKCEAFRFRVSAINKGDVPNIDGTIIFRFIDINDRSALLQFGVDPNGVFFAKELRMDNPNWEVDPGFDWTQVVKWYWMLPCINVSPYRWGGCSFWIDVGPFFYWWEEDGVQPPKTWVRLRCEGIATTHCLLFHGEYSETVMVPTDFTVSPPGEWGFRALGEGFEYWIVNGTRYDDREILLLLEEGSDTTLTIHSKGIGFEDPIAAFAMIVGIVSGVIGIGGVIYSGIQYLRDRGLI
jgi:hypothetical protein